MARGRRRFRLSSPRMLSGWHTAKGFGWRNAEAAH